MLRSYIGLKIQGAQQEAIYGPELHFSRILHWLQPVETQLLLEKTYISHVVLEQQKCITTQRFISVWEKAAATDFPPLTSRIFEISSDPFGFNAKICPWKIIPITLFGFKWEKMWKSQILTWFEVTSSILLSGESITVETGWPICHVLIMSIWAPLICRQCTALPWKT